MSAEGKTSFFVEVPYFGKLGYEEESKLVKECRTHLLREGLFAEEEIIGVVTEQLPFAYPVLKKGYEKQLALVRSYLDQFENLHLTGRNGLYAYSWFHDMMDNGAEVVDRLK